MTTLVAAVALGVATPPVSDACWRSCGYGYGCDYGCWGGGPCWGGYCCDSWYGGCGYCSSYVPSYGYPYAGIYVYPAQAYAGTQPVAPANTASIRVTVPADAKLWFDDKKTTQTGSERLFESPPLRPRGAYSYDIKAQWRDQDGKEVTQVRHVGMSANSSISVDFRPVAAE